MRFLKHLGKLLLSLAVTAVVGGLVTAAMVRFSPGFAIDEHELDPGRDTAALRAAELSRPEQQDLLRYTANHIAGMLRGDFGVSRNWRRPVAGLLGERWPVTAKLMAVGLAGGWSLALLLALSGLIFHSSLWKIFAAGLSDALLCVPSAALALLIFVYAGPVRAVMALAVFPRLYQYLQNLLSHAANQPHVLAARARGISGTRILFRHIMPVAMPQILALAGTSLSIAFGAAVVVEVICDFPGIGQLAWKAALARDLPLLVTLTMAVTCCTQMANSAADLFTPNRLKEST